MDSVRVWRRRTAEKCWPGGAHEDVGNSPSVTRWRIDKPEHNGLSKSQILRGYRAFGDVLSHRRYVQSGYIRCYFDKQREVPPYMCTVGFAVRKAPSAVVRNRARRLMRESFRHRQHAVNTLCTKEEFAISCIFLLDARRIKGVLSFQYVDASVNDLLTSLLNRLTEV
jgi:ribonuclease P protein component